MYNRSRRLDAEAESLKPSGHRSDRWAVPTHRDHPWERDARAERERRQRSKRPAESPVERLKKEALEQRLDNAMHTRKPAKARSTSGPVWGADVERHGKRSRRQPKPRAPLVRQATARRPHLSIPRLEASPKEQRVVTILALAGWALWSWLHGGHAAFFVW